jgi:hypothetical protein
VSLKKREKHRKKKAGRLAASPPSFKPDELRQILEAGNSATLVEFVGFRCLHNPKGAVASYETYIQHRAEGCRVFRAADNYADLTGPRTPIPAPETPLEARGGPRDVASAVLGVSLGVAAEIEGKERAGEWTPKPKPPLGKIRKFDD